MTTTTEQTERVAQLHRGIAPGCGMAARRRRTATIHRLHCAGVCGAPWPCEWPQAQPTTPEPDAAPRWRHNDAAIDAKALATAQEIALMWGQDRLAIRVADSGRRS